MADFCSVIETLRRKAAPHVDQVPITEVDCGASTAG